MIVEDAGGILPLLEAEMTVCEDKDVVSVKDGVYQGVSFRIETILTARGTYYASTKVGKRSEITREHATAELAEHAGISVASFMLSEVCDAS